MALTFAAALTPVPFLGALTAGDIIALINTSTFFGKFILFVLLVMSVLSWAVFLDKARTYAKLRRGHLAFWDHCERWLAGEVNRRDLDVGFQDAEAALNVGKALVAGDGLCRGEIRCIGQEGQLAVKEFRRGNGVFIERPGEPVGGVIGFDEACQFGFGYGPDEATVGAPV